MCIFDLVFQYRYQAEDHHVDNTFGYVGQAARGLPFSVAGEGKEVSFSVAFGNKYVLFPQANTRCGWVLGGAGGAVVPGRPGTLERPGRRQQVTGNGCMMTARVNTVGTLGGAACSWCLL